MNLSEWTEHLLRAYAADLPRARVAELRNSIEAGEAWLAAYDLLRQAMEREVLAGDDLARAMEAAEAGAFNRKMTPRLLAALRQYRAEHFAAA